MMEKICKGTLLAKKEGIYTVYVFSIEDGYMMCTRLPNWDCNELFIGDTGYILYEEAIAGQKYFCSKTNTYEQFRYSNVYFKNFIKELEEITEDIIVT